MRTETTTIPSSEELRQALIARAAKFCELTGITKSELGKLAVGDVAFIGELEAGRNITLKLYEKFRRYLNSKWPNGVAKKRGRS